VSTVTIGTSGWSYPEWKQSIYAGVPQRGWLERYAELFGAVEANITYRRDLSEDAAARWLTATPPEFRYVIKAHQRATHLNRLKKPDVDVPLQTAQAELLGERLGIVYFQVPHNFLRDDDLLAAFLDVWPPAIPVAWEFLHRSWDEAVVRDLLRAHDVSWVISDATTSEPGFHTTSSTAYVRLRAESYDLDSLEQRATEISALDVERTWVFVRHGADAPHLALQLADLVG
jgi:uncharacterized protein YecE (DUF72 family)